MGGDENAKLDMEDLKQHVQYEGGYHARHKVIKNLWQVRGTIAQLSWLPLLGSFCSNCPRNVFLGSVESVHLSLQNAEPSQVIDGSAVIAHSRAVRVARRWSRT